MRASKSKVQLYAAIRRDHRIEDLSIRLLAERYGVRRREVRKALQSVFPEPPKKMKPRGSRLDPYKPALIPGYAAIVDRLTFGSNFIETGNESYRLSHTRA
jgi:hypothetical protein